MNRQFFQSNRIKSSIILTTSSVKKQSSVSNLNSNLLNSGTQAQHEHGHSKKLKRVTSCHQDHSSRLTNFKPRQTFQPLLQYSTKPMNITVEFGKSDYRQQDKMLESIMAGLLEKIKGMDQRRELIEGMKNIQHWMRVLGEFFQETSSKGREIKGIREALGKVIRAVTGQLERRDRIVKDFKVKQLSGSEGRHTSNHKRSQPIRDSSSKQLHLNQSQLLESKLGNLTSTSFSKQKSLTSRLNLLQFEHKKQTLLIQSLNQQLQTKSTRISQLQDHLTQMTQKVQKINQLQEFYNFKIKKLKEELQVAHIVKQQNLEEKMKYIMKAG